MRGFNSFDQRTVKVLSFNNGNINSVFVIQRILRKIAFGDCRNYAECLRKTNNICEK